MYDWEKSVINFSIIFIEMESICIICRLVNFSYVILNMYIYVFSFFCII